MKIWKAELISLYSENNMYKIKLSFELQKKEYEANKNFSEWTWFENWVGDAIPMKMTIERYYDNYKIIQGFDHELNEEELKQLEKDMRELMKKQLEHDKENFLKEYEKKLGIIQG